MPSTSRLLRLFFFQVGLVIDQLYDVPCKILHIPKGQLKNHINELVAHFTNRGAPIMMGGDQDCSSKGIVGIHVTPADSHLLIVDPHFEGIPRFIGKLHRNNWVKWTSVDEFLDSSFYNLCLPQVSYRK